MTTVLVVEDNSYNLKLAQVILERGGYTVLTAMSGEQGLVAARTHLPDLILMDMQMPGMDGIAATQALRHDPATARIKVLALTGLAMSGDQERILAAGCNAYLTKPYRYQDLLDGVARLLAAP
jgi:two-component system cell cycle response regulator DivK